MLLQSLVLGAVTGLASSAHCAAMCGPLAASACAQQNARGSLLRYQAGRTAGYALAGAIAGGFGRALSVSSISPALMYVVPVVTALSLLLLARRVLGEQSTLVRLERKRARKRRTFFAWLARYAPADPGSLGALTALLPCAALGAALLLAATTQARASGAALTAGFAATTAIGVLGGAAALARLARLGGRHTPRLLATVLACAALYVGLTPLYRELRAPSPHAAHAPSCH